MTKKQKNEWAKVVQTGTVVCFYGSRAPKGWIWCRGQKARGALAQLTGPKLPCLPHFIIKA